MEEEPGYIGCLDLNNNKSSLLVPKLDQLHAIWVSGDKIETLEEKKKIQSRSSNIFTKL